MNKLSENKLSEAEKLAFLRTVGKVLKNVDLVAGTKGIREGLKVLEKHKGPMFALPKGALKNPIKEKTYSKDTGGASKFVLRELGDTAHGLLRVSEGVGKGKPIVDNITRLGSNFGKLLKDQLRGARYKTTSPKNVVKTGPGGRQVKGKGLFAQDKIFNRKIEGKTSSGDLVLKKRKATVPFSMALSPVGFGAGSFLLGSGKKNETVGSRTKAGLQETALWSIAPPVAQVKLISDMLK